MTIYNILFKIKWHSSKLKHFNTQSLIDIVK